ncbi:MAG: patatin-like phospholipase family protein [Planctomycetota bacterium]
MRTDEVQDDGGTRRRARGKRALVMSGGGSKGAWQAGAVDWVLAEAGRTYDIYCGVSVGALNASFLAMYGPGDEADAAGGLLDLWRAIRTKDVRRHHRPFGFLHGLWRPNLYDSRPLQRFVRQRLDPVRLRASGKELRVGAVSLDDGGYRLFDQHDDAIVEAVLASAAFPAFLEPIRIRGTLFTDGGIRNVTPLGAAIDAGADRVDVLLTEPSRLETAWGRFRRMPPSAPELAVRALEIMLNEIVENDLVVARRTNDVLRHESIPGKRHVEVRVLRPSRPLTFDSLTFEREDLDAALLQGLEDARAWLARTDGAAGQAEPAPPHPLDPG